MDYFVYGNIDFLSFVFKILLFNVLSRVPPYNDHSANDIPGKAICFDLSIKALPLENKQMLYSCKHYKGKVTNMKFDHLRMIATIL